MEHSMTRQTFTVNEALSWLQNNDRPEQLAEIRGVLCGLICSGVQSEGRAWIDGVLGNLLQTDMDIPMQRALIIELYKELSYEFQTNQFKFSHVLFSDSLPLALRAQVLTRWCTGFLLGLELAGLPVRENLSSAELAEAICRFAEVSKLDYGSIDVTQEDEKMFQTLISYFEITLNQIYCLLNHIRAKH